MERLNEVLLELVRKKGTNKKVAAPLGITPQALGKYLKGRRLPVSLLTRWKEVYGEDLMKLANGEKEPNVSRETSKNVSFRDEIFEGEYIGMHQRVWTQHELNMATHRELLKDLVATVKNLTQAGNG